MRLLFLCRLSLRYSDVIHGFVDPYSYVREVRTDLGTRHPGKKSILGIKQGELMETLGVETSGGGHNAKWDADNLRKLTVRLMVKKGEKKVDQAEAKRRLLAVKGAGEIFAKTTKQFKKDLKKKPDGRERVWRKHFK